MLLDLSLVTRSLTTLLKNNITAIFPTLGPFVVSPLPPDQFKDEGIAMYLFHLGEDPHFKNTPPPSTDTPPVRFTPMGLDLYYLMTAHSKAGGDQTALNEQTMMGLAVKTMHDFGIIDDSTIAGSPPKPVFPGALMGFGNRFRLSIEPVTFSDAPQYWTAGQQPLRLAAYYHISVALLEPDSSRHFAGRVLRYGVFAFDRSGPRLDASTNVVNFVSPIDNVARTIEAQPAEVPVGSAVTFVGSNLMGDSTALVINYPFWPASIEADPAWGVVVAGESITATVQPVIGAGLQTIVPGVYTAHASVSETRRLPDGTYKQFSNVSNDTPFSIAPNVTNISAFDGTGTATITGATFGALIKKEDVVVLLGADRLDPVTNPPPLPRSAFFVQNATTIVFRMRNGLLSNTFLPLRVIVNGVESGPQWVKIP